MIVKTKAPTLLLLLTLALGVQTARADSPRIEKRAGEPILVLTAPMNAALRAFDPEFRVRRLSDYPPYLWRPACTEAPDCARSLYQIKPREALFAVIGDFNGDGVLDAVLDGDNRTVGRRLVVLSSGSAFSVSELQQLPRIPGHIESYRDNKNAIRLEDDGLQEGLSLARAGRHRSPYEPRPLILKTDGVVVSTFDRAAVLYFLRKGKWNEYIIAD